MPFLLNMIDDKYEYEAGQEVNWTALTVTKKDLELLMIEDRPHLSGDESINRSLRATIIDFMLYAMQSIDSRRLIKTSIIRRIRLFCAITTRNLILDQRWMEALLQ